MMFSRSGKNLVMMCVLCASTLAIVLSTGGVRAASLGSCSPWTAVSSPNPALIDNVLTAVVAVAPTDVWAVGFDDRGTLTEHWDGSAWTVVASPNASPRMNNLFGVAAISTSDVWAVGDAFDSSSVTYHTLIEHWDGSTWSVIPSPNVGLDTNELLAVTAISAQDVWAVGDYFQDGDQGRTGRTLTEHWDGASWSVVPSPSVGKAQIEDNILSAVTATSAQDVWAAGMKVVEGSKVPRQTLILHWDGKSWHVMDSPNGSQPNNELFGIAAISTSDVWAVGDMSSDTTPPQPLTEHWNGRKWSTITSPTFAGGAVLSGVASLSPDAVWAVGTFKDSRNLPNTLTEQWDGASWSVVESPSPFVQGNTLSAVAVVPGTQSLWSVGYGVDQLDDFRTLTESYCV